MPVHKAVIPAAGLGTRFLPATKSQAKEMIPVVDKPGIQYVVEEAVRGGATEILLVTSRGKSAMEDHFDRSLELEYHLERTGKTAELEEVRSIAALANVAAVRQKEPRGFGDAVMLGKAFAGSDPFIVMVGDEIVPEPRDDEEPLIERMIDIHEREGASVLAVQQVERSAIPSYGIVTPVGAAEGDAVRITGMVEKPKAEDAPSDLAARGRYLFSPSIFDAIEETSAGVGGEIQLTDAINLLAQREPVFAYVHRGPILDVGKKLDYLKASIELALRRPDLSDAFGAWLRDRAADI